MGNLIPDFSSLPPWGQVVAYAVFAISVAVVLLAARFGIRLGKLGPAPRETGATVAAVVVDPTALTAATTAIAQIDVTLVKLTEVIHELARANSQLADLAGQYLADQRQDREEEETRKIHDEGYAEGLAAGRRVPPRRKPPRKKTTP